MKSGKPIAQANIQPELPKFDPKNLLECADKFAEFLLLTGQSHVDMTSKCSLLKCSCKTKFLQKQVKQIVKICSTWADVLQRLEKTFPVYETDLSVRTQIKELPLLPEFPSAARISEYVCNLVYLFSRMKVGSYGPTKPWLWRVGEIPHLTWEDCRSSSKTKQRTHTSDDPVDLLIQLALKRGNDSHMGNTSRGSWGKVPIPPLTVVSWKGPKPRSTPTRVEVKRAGNLRAMNEVKPDTGVPPLFYCNPVNGEGGPCHVPDCDHRSGCMLQLKRQQHTKYGKTMNYQDHFRCTITFGLCGKRHHCEDECHIKRRESDKRRCQEAERQKN